MCDIETFLSQWLGKIQDELATMDATAGSASVRRRFQALQDEKKRWEAKRQRELDEIEQKAGQLTDAWLKLESEQRQLLKLQERRGSRRETTSATATQVEASPEPARTSAPAPAAPSSGPSRRTNNSVATNQKSSNGAMKTLSEAVRQFEQLRREIELTRAST